MHHPITINDIGPWMTFDYLNVVFKLEPNYLKNALGISDNRYPNININMYARHYNIPLQNLLQNIKQAITSYSSKN
jgi:hypothetical protein